MLVDFPQSVRAHARVPARRTLLFTLPLLAIGWATYQDPGFLLHLADAQTAQDYDRMYDESARALGRGRDAATDWQMFGFYVMHNIGIGFQCFAGGVFAGLGSVFFLVFNGAQIGAVAGYLTARGHSENFYSSWSRTCLRADGHRSRRCGGPAWARALAPGAHAAQALKRAAGDAIVVVYA